MAIGNKHDQGAATQLEARPPLTTSTMAWTALAILVALTGGLALFAAFPPVGIWPFAAAGPALLVVALWRRRGRFRLAGPCVLAGNLDGASLSTQGGRLHPARHWRGTGFGSGSARGGRSLDRGGFCYRSRGDRIDRGSGGAWRNEGKLKRPD